MRYVVATPPSVEPVSLATAKSHLHIDTDDTSSDAYLPLLIQAVREHAERHCRRAFITQTINLYADTFEAHLLQLPYGNLQSISYIKYLDTDGIEQTLDASKYVVDAQSIPGRIVPAFGEVWPSTQYMINAVRIQAVVGFGDADTDVPNDIRVAMLLHLGHLFENREETTPVPVSSIPMGYDALLATHRLPAFG